MFTNSLKSYKICLFILVRQHTMESINFLWFSKYTWTKYWSIFVYSLWQTMLPSILLSQNYWQLYCINNNNFKTLWIILIFKRLVVRMFNNWIIVCVLVNLLFIKHEQFQKNILLCINLWFGSKNGSVQNIRA